MLCNMVIYRKNGFGLGNLSYVDWNLSINMRSSATTRIMFVSLEGDVLDAIFHDKLIMLFDFATQMNVMTDALAFHVPFSFMQLQAFMTEHAIEHTVVSDMDMDTLDMFPAIVPNKEIISVLSDPVSIDIFHMMMETEAMAYDDANAELCEDIDIMDFIDAELCVDLMDML